MTTLGELLLYASALPCVGALVGAAVALRCVWRVRHVRRLPRSVVGRLR